MRYFLELAYNGETFHGWQAQPNAVSVQSVIEKALSTVLGHPISIVGAGRTDAGVHARQMFAHFDTERTICNDIRFLQSLNSLVGKNIAVKRIFQVRPDAHARFDASKRTYKYFVTYNKNPFLKDFCWFSPTALDLGKMNSAANLLLSINDFTSFAKLHSDTKTNICNVTEAIWRPLVDDPQGREFLGCLNDGIVFTISADRFLRNMVRAVVGTLVDVGRNKISENDFQKIILEKNRCSAGTSMPGHALFLWEINYKDLV